MSGIGRVLVVIPARDEEEVVAACLASVRAAAVAAGRERPSLEVRVVLVADACTDRTAEIARAAGAEVVEIAAGSVGVARQAGVERGARLWPSGASGPLWIASTDADSVVPESWIRDQLAAADDGADLVVGRVEPDGRLDPELLAAWRAAHAGRAPGESVHGANLGVRADALARVGGFSPMPLHEDVDLVERLLASGARLDREARPAVETSSRLRSRVDGGFASYLARLGDARGPSTASGEVVPLA